MFKNMTNAVVFMATSYRTIAVAAIPTGFAPY